MNFFAHAALALWRSDDPRFVLGSMLPDFAGMLGLRVLRIDDRALAAGVTYHHATDAAFHRAPLFVELCTRGIETLSAAGVARGTARAVAHVGTELLLDGALSHLQPARVAYQGSLRAALSERYVDAFTLEAEEHVERFQTGLARLATAPVPDGYRDPEFVLARLRSTLTRRPRLAMRDTDVEHVRSHLHEFEPLVRQGWPELLDQVRTELCRAETAASA